MILVDANLLVYASLRDLPQHDRARAWLEGRLSGTGRVGLPWPSLLSFMRLACNPRIFERPVPLASIWREVQRWLELPQVWVPAPTQRHAEILGPLIEQETRPNLVPDAHLAALAIEHGLLLCSTDRDFARFEGVRWTNPLESSANSA